MRVAAIDFLNTAPLMWDFAHPPRAAELAPRYDVAFMHPDRCALRLADGSSDIGLVPVAAYTTVPGLKIVPGLAIASLNRVRSILLVTQRDLADVRSVSLDTTSRTSAALTRVLLERVAHVRPAYRTHAPQLEAMLAEADAALLIGDPALLARESGVCSRYQCFDLAQMWREHTGLPFVFAFWAIRGDAVPRNPAQLVEDFQHSLAAGRQNLDALIEEWASRIAVPRETIRAYWTENIHYTLDDQCLAGLQLFYRYAAECGALPAAPPLAFL